MTLLHWHYPTEILVGEHASSQLASVCKTRSIQRPLFVVDPALTDNQTTRNLVLSCQSADLPSSIFSDFSGNPTGEQVEYGIEYFLKGNHDGVVTLGGGSSIDIGKAIALVAKQQQPLWQFEDINENWTKADANLIAPVIALPTTAGTGSEVGRASVITDTQSQSKRIIFHPKMLPVQVILDPVLSVDLPPHLTAATGMDALSHNLEAYCSPSYHPMAEAIAIEGMRLIKLYLPIAHIDGNNLQARTQMLIASTMGATAFQKGLGAMHALAHTLGGRYNLHHGLLNAVLMPYVLCANRHYLHEKMLRLSHYLELENEGFDGVLEWILALRKQLHIPHTMAELGVNIQDQKAIAAQSVQDAAASGNPIHLSQEQYENVFYHSLNGTLDL
ncbi:iron-containing alcohol dehydrogenase [Photobacterium sp. DNB23_23_1]|uniref:Iron-containing alcohol dehydrogenase n=1 Tax=Photobacterium pectinilyticum TaxID=2906793 RepID=A0ABT1N7H5_9GAMM|nr:iron-containing alcohol dehydrogenase [Photobacterium sp. ZSDE20]MCQ1059774.1 iron-containing alcohol dehydrogenase [Photobacterium sp. ZSDE20]MDD1826009.1 iron-containing alcohol dehydrogenase [Photobacterium sp. ZSDE20]